MFTQNWFRWIVIFVVLLGAGPAAFNVQGSAQNIPEPPPPLPNLPAGFFVHTATAANTAGAVTYIDHPQLNGSNHYYVYVSQNWNPPGSSGVYNDSAIGLWYTANGPADPALQNRWAVVNQDGSNIPLGASFNIMYLGEVATSESFLHYASSGDVGLTYTIIDNPVVNDDPNARLVLTYYEGMGGSAPSKPFNHNLGVFYNPTTGRWAILCEDGNSASPCSWFENARVEVLDVSGFANSTFMYSTSSNTSGNYAWFSNPASDDRPNALVFPTHYFGLSTDPSFLWLDHPLGMWFGTFPDMNWGWSVFFEDLAAMPQYASFFLFIIPVECVYLPAIVR